MVIFLRQKGSLSKSLGSTRIEGWVGPRAALGVFRKRTLLPLPRIEPRCLGLELIALTQQTILWCIHTQPNSKLSILVNPHLGLDMYIN